MSAQMGSNTQRGFWHIPQQNYSSVGCSNILSLKTFKKLFTEKRKPEKPK